MNLAGRKKKVFLTVNFSYLEQRLLNIVTTDHVNGDYVSELQPPTGLLFIPQVIYVHEEP
jgi:hypothetical protein